MAAGATALIYNGVTIGNCQTLVFEQQSIYDASDTDYLYTRFRIRVAGYFTGFVSTTVHTLPQKSSPTSATEHIVALRHALSEPRKAFNFVFGATRDATSGFLSAGESIVQAVPALGSRVNTPHLELNNGPKPRQLSITNVAGDTALRVEYEIEVCINTCPQSDNNIFGSLSPVMSNKWTAADTINQNWYTTRTYRGQLRLKVAIVNAHEFRGVVIPPMTAGMRRESMDFSVSRDGLVLDYTIVDREVAFAAPKPATNWDYRHTERMGGPFGVNVHSSCRVMLEGDRTVDKKILINIGASIIDGLLLLTKLLAGNLANKLPLKDEDAVREHGGRAILTDFEVTVESGSSQTNRVTISAGMKRIMMDRDRIEQMASGLGVPIDDKVLKPSETNENLEYEPDRSRGHRTGETLDMQGPIGVANLFASHIQSVCDGNDRHDMCDGLTPLLFRTGPCQLEVLINPRESEDIAVLPDQTFSEDHQENAYTAYDMTNRIWTDEGIMQLPIARDDTTGDAPADENSVMVKLHPSQTRRIVRIHAERIGSPPDLPEPKKVLKDRNNNKMVLLHTHIVTQEPERNFDNQVIYRVDAEYSYAISGEVRTIDFGTPAYSKEEIPERSGIGFRDIFRLDPTKHTQGASAIQYTPPDMPRGDTGSENQ